MTTRNVYEVEGASLFRTHIISSLLSNRPIRITNIHPENDTPGLTDYEVNLLKFIVRLTQETRLEILPNKTQVTLHPGVILGGSFSHEVPTSRCITYLIEAAVILLPFAKYKSTITFVGATQHPIDLSLDTMRTVSLRWLQLFGVLASLSLVRRGAPPGGGGVAVLTVTPVRKLRCVTAQQRGKVKRVRGIAFSSNASGDLVKECSSAAKGVLLKFLPDVYVVSDPYHAKIKDAEEARRSGYGILLVAETTQTTCVVSQEVAAERGDKPEDVGRMAAKLLLDQIAAGGCVDAHHQAMVIMLMVLAPAEVSTVRFGRLTPSAVSTMMACEEFFGVSCAVKDDPTSGLGPGTTSVIVSCIGSNSVNLVKPTT